MRVSSYHWDYGEFKTGIFLPFQSTVMEVSWSNWDSCCVVCLFFFALESSQVVSDSHLANAVFVTVALTQ